MNQVTSGPSDKLRIIDEETYNQIRRNSLKNPQITIIRKTKRARQIPNLSQFINERCQHKKPKRKPTSYAIYRPVKKKSVKKSKVKKKSKLKKCILKYRLLKRSQKDNSQRNEVALPAVITEKCENLSVRNVEDKPKAVHSKRFREYCDNTTSPELNTLVETLLRKLNHFQKRAFKINNFKGKSRRRMVIGFREVQVQMKIDKIKCVIIATDCEKCDFEDGLDNIIMEIKEDCKKANIPCVFGLQRRKLSYALHQKCPASCVGIVDYDGAQDIFFQLIERLEVEKSNYSRLFT